MDESLLTGDGEYIIKVGTRGSNLAVIQKDLIVNLIKEKHKYINFRTIIINTIGDKITSIPISNIGRAGVFTEELGRALSSKELDVVVHSLKDLPTKMNHDSVICMISEREIPYDVVVFNKYSSLSQIPKNGVVGTSSPRRIAQLRWKFPHLQVQDIRGNLVTRIKKLNEGNKYDALILAQAGLIRSGFEDLSTQCLKEDFLYAVGQGALAIEARRTDNRIIEMCASLSHVPTIIRCVCERAILKTLEGGCCVPLGVETNIIENTLNVKCGVFALNGQEQIIQEIVVELPKFNHENLPPYETVSGVVVSVHCKGAALISCETGKKLALRIIESGGRELMQNIPHICLDRPREKIVSYNIDV